MGAGLAGTLLSLLLSQLEEERLNKEGGREGKEEEKSIIYLFEKREEEVEENHHHDDSSNSASLAFGNSTSAVKRSINLALSHRGISALKALQDVSILKECMAEAIAMPGRVIHQRNGDILQQKYGTKESDINWSVSRQKLNRVLLQAAKKKRNIKIQFGHSLVFCDKEGNCHFQPSSSKDALVKFEGASAFDLVVGADGAYSSVRDHILKLGRISFQREYISHGYKELSIPPKYCIYPF